MAFKSRAAALLPSSHPSTASSPPSCFFCSYCHSVLQSSSALSTSLAPSLSPSTLSTLSLTLSIFTLSTLLSSNVFPVCLTGGCRQKGNLSQGQTDSTNRLLQTVATTLAAVLRRGILSHYAHFRLISARERQQKSYIYINVQAKDV